jgi:diacylglycerol kinase
MNSYRTSWVLKFRYALTGVVTAVRGGSSFLAHLAITALVIAAAAFFRVSRTEWCLLTGCIATVLAAECFNSALESLAKAITSDHDPRVGQALDMAAGAVLLVAIGSVVIGLLVFTPYILPAR